MKKRLMTLEDLYSYYSSNTKSSHFSAKDEGDTIVVQVGGIVKFEENNSPFDGLLPVTLRACHDLDNANGSYISKENLEAALPSFSNRPILAYIHEVDGQNEFYDHRMHLDEDGKLIYDEKPIGIIPESANAHLEYNEELGKDQVVVNGFIFEEYSDAAEILKRDGCCYVSVELSIRELSYDAKEKRLNIENFYFSGVTALGKNPDGEIVKPGMVGSDMKLADFKLKNSESCFSESNVLDMLEKISDKLDVISTYSINKNLEEGGKTMTKFEELLEQYGKTAEEIEFEYEGLSDEELEVAFAEAFAEAEGDAGEGEAPASEENPDEPEGEDGDNAEDVDSTEENYSVKYSMSYGENTKEFSISLSDKIYALQELVNDTYSEIDNDWYYCDVFEEDGYLIMHGFNRSYKQEFKCKKKKCYQLVGDRCEVYAQWLTEDQINALESMKSNYFSIESELAEKSAKLQKYEEEPQKMEILNSQKYGYVADTEEFTALVADHFDLSVEDVTSKANDILLSYADKGALKFALESNEGNKVANQKLPTTNKKSGRYGNLFSK